MWFPVLVKILASTLVPLTSFWPHYLWSKIHFGAWNKRYNPTLCISYISVETVHPVTWILCQWSACFQCLFTSTYCMFQDTMVRLQSYFNVLSHTGFSCHTLMWCVPHYFFVYLISKHFSYQNKGSTAEFYDQALANDDRMSLDNLKILTV